uniref:Uncharacterized protein n=1 Tax=Cacopsylla melanoneura TaxID=428564 RepID=A0A8D8WGA2_9HEMI
MISFHFGFLVQIVQSRFLGIFHKFPHHPSCFPPSPLVSTPAPTLDRPLSLSFSAIMTLISDILLLMFCCCITLGVLLRMTFIFPPTLASLVSHLHTVLYIVTIIIADIIIMLT